MIAAESPFQKNRTLHLVVTDSGIGGLSICAEIERNLRRGGTGPEVRITYFNAWPEERSGYNDLPQMQARADMFDRALNRMWELEPDQILIACNTLSILYDLTAFKRTTTIAVLGIIDAGVELFYEALSADPHSFIVIFGTRTTIESRVHRDRLIQKGIKEQQISGIACHGLAAAIERDPDSSAVADLIEKCAADAGKAFPPIVQHYAGLACTHYTYVKDSISAALEKQSGRKVQLLDPNQRMIRGVAPPVEATRFEPAARNVTVEVISKVELSELQRRAVAKRIEPVSAATARALLYYTHDPGLF
jgi:glutamate racemase